MSFTDTQNPGIGGLDEITLAEGIALQTIAGLGSPLQVLRTNAGGTAVEWATGGGGGSGDVTGPASSVDNTIARYDSTTGKIIQGSTISIGDTGIIAPTTSDAGALGSTTLMWSDLFLASGAVINFNNGDVTVTHSANTLTFAGAATGYAYDSHSYPTVTNTSDLGTSSLAWRTGYFGTSLLLSSGFVFNWNSSDVTLTHSANDLAIAGGTLTVTDGVLVGTNGFSAKDSSNSFYGTLKFGDAMTAARTLNFNLNDATRTVSLATNLTVPADPNADAILFWDDSAGATTWLTVGSGLAITGTTIATTGGGGGTGITWTEVTGTSQTASVNSGYVANNASLVTITLPTTAAVGDIVRVVGKGAGLWKIAQNASEQIHFGNQNTTSGVGGSLEAVHRYDSVELVCIVADTEWVVSSSIGNITVV